MLVERDVTRGEYTCELAGSIQVPIPSNNFPATSAGPLYESNTRILSVIDGWCREGGDFNLLGQTQTHQQKKIGVVMPHRALQCPIAL